MPACWNCNGEGSALDIQIRKGSLSELEDFIRLTHRVQAGMDRTEWFAIDPDEETRELARTGDLQFWAAEAEGRMAGVFSTIRPGLREFNLGYELAMTAPELERVIHMDTAAVDPDFRGQGIQRRLISCAEEELQGKILLCTIHPDNRYSLQNMQKLGYSIEKKVARYGSIRYILRKDT